MDLFSQHNEADELVNLLPYEGTVHYYGHIYERDEADARNVIKQYSLGE